MNNISYEENKRRFDALSTWDKHYAVNANTGEKMRFAKYEDGSVFLYAKGYKNKGWNYDEQHLLDNYIVCAPPDLNKQWHSRIKRAKAAILKSGIWSRELEYLDNLDKMTWEDKKYLDKIYWNMHPGFSGVKDTKENWQKWNLTLLPYANKYPFMFSSDPNGNLVMDNKYTWERSNVKLKSMYFGKYRNADIKQEIKNAYTEHKSYNCQLQLGYDTSFEYNAEKNMAWFSEEYRGCENGHYYIALDENSAWFIEDD